MKYNQPGPGFELYIDKHILNKGKTRRKNLATAWIDYKKAYAMILQSWIINCLEIYKISNQVMNFIEKNHEIPGEWNWQQEKEA